MKFLRYLIVFGILFISSVAANGTLYAEYNICFASHSGLQSCESGGVYQRPRFSPDGSQIAYILNRSKLLVYNIDTGITDDVTPQELSGEDYVIQDFSWGSSGQELVVTILEVSASNIWHVSSSGMEVYQLTNTDNAFNLTSPNCLLQDGSLVFLSDRLGKLSVWLRDTNGEFYEMDYQTDGEVGVLRCSPERQYISILDDRGTDNQQTVILSGDDLSPVHTISYSTEVVWSRDGDFVAYVANNGDIEVLNLETLASTPVVANDGQQSYKIDTFETEGTDIFFTNQNEEFVRIWAIDTDTLTLVPLTDEFNFSVRGYSTSPTGEYVALEVTNGDGTEIATYSVNDGTLANISACVDQIE